MFRTVFLGILCIYWCECSKQIWNHAAIGKAYAWQPFYEVSLMDERQCFGQCVYNEKCLSFEVYQTVPRKVECRLFDFVYEYYTKFKELDTKVGSKIYSKPLEKVCTTCKSCLDYSKKGHLKNGVYEVDLLGTRRGVYCFMEGEGGGWMAFQRRYDGSVSFEDKEWAEYKDGFGDGSGEYWLGLETLHQLTSTQSYDLYARAMDFSGVWESKRFAGFTIGSELMEKYKFDFQSIYSGTQYSNHSLFERAKGMKFSTPTRDNDLYTPIPTCAIRFPGGWWFSDCHYDFMNGAYSQQESCDRATGIHWYRRFGENHNKCLKETLLMIREN
ncbi:microfibril-associated glycoprotein 4-like [Clytia hemisphaerica]|uniref:Fibrinogen C-terminal domain-containing protein n=1 Tax=Clytia hemisphaerica TaxID=252671 RepID=A0A7M5WUU2_9CNID